jgi:benzoyl-CoA 2,3-dioxygenase component B
VPLVDLNDTIPNNVDLGSDRKLQRALERWHPQFLDWWRDMGPVEHQDHDVFLRTAISVGKDGWAHFDYVKMPEYRWGIFLAEADTERKIGFGDLMGEPVWTDVPGELRADLRRLIVVQGDTEPASVEQQRHLCRTAPSLYDMRNLFQINVEEARHLWAMVYLLHAYFGRDGRDEADMLLERHSGHPDNPRILGAFNEPTPDWLSFFMFTYFTDRDGKFQLASLAESGFDPLARTCQFMLKEEAHHMFVGAGGIGRIVQRTAELMREHDTDDVATYGGISLGTIQRYLNLHFSVSLDLFGAESSTNAANYFAAGLKGRFQESNRRDDHRLHESEVSVPVVDGGRIGERATPALSALNATLRDDYVEDCQNGLNRWNRVLAAAGAPPLELPHPGFNRKVGAFAGHHIGVDGCVLSAKDWDARLDEWLPTDADREHVASLMVPVSEPGKMASYLAPPSSGVATKPVDYEYVRAS